MKKGGARGSALFYAPFLRICVFCTRRLGMDAFLPCCFGISGNEKGGVRAPPFRNFRGVNYAALSCAFALRQKILSKTEKDKPKISETIVDRAMP